MFACTYMCEYMNEFMCMCVVFIFYVCVHLYVRVCTYVHNYISQFPDWNVSAYLFVPVSVCSSPLSVCLYDASVCLSVCSARVCSGYCVTR